MNRCRRRRAGVLLGLLVFALGASARAEKLFETVDAATPGGAKVRLAVPADWNSQLLIIAHGYIPAGRPLYAGFDPGDPVYHSLLERGWLIAATSYRRNGFVFEDAAADVEELRAFVAKRQGQDPDVVIVEGTSMGGFVAAQLAEHPPHPSYRGALALGAALKIEQPGVTPPTLTGKPRFPVLFLSNRDEAAGPTDYARGGVGDPHAVVWTVARDGHVNLNRAEIGAAFEALWQWVDAGKTPAARDATVVPPAAPRTVRFAPGDRAATGKVVAVDPAFGNLTVDFRPADLVRLGLKKGDHARLQFGNATATAGPKEVDALLGTTFGDVKEGEWVCFPTADGYSLICRNFADAAGSTGAKVGTTVTVRRTAP